LQWFGPKQSPSLLHVAPDAAGGFCTVHASERSPEPSMESEHVSPLTHGAAEQSAPVAAGASHVPHVVDPPSAVSAPALHPPLAHCKPLEHVAPTSSVPFGIPVLHSGICEMLVLQSAAWILAAHVPIAASKFGAMPGNFSSASHRVAKRELFALT
jgi:hypothetical protein